MSLTCRLPRSLHCGAQVRQWDVNAQRLPGALPVALTLHVDHQQGVADGEWCPEAHSLRRGQEVPVDESHGCQVAHGKGHGQGTAQQLGEAMCAGQQAQADPTVVLAAVQLVETTDVTAEALGDRTKQGGQPEAQQQVQSAVRGTLLQEAQAAGQPAAQRVLAQQVQLQPLSAPGALVGEVAEEGPQWWASGLPSPQGHQEGSQGTDAPGTGGWRPKEPLDSFSKRE